MKIIIIYFCVALLPSTIHCSPRNDANRHIIDPEIEAENLKVALDEMAEKRVTVNDIFKPSENGFLGSGEYCLVYKGTLHYPNTEAVEVAMKFTHIRDKKYAEKEYEIYSYLDAIDNPSVELYGIPNCYYWGTWDGDGDTIDFACIMMGITLLDLNPGSADCDRISHINEIDLLIMCKDFVRASKYMHSRGIYHNDIRFLSLMFRRNNVFIIDYNLAEKMYTTTTLDASSREIGIQHAKHDWKKFLKALTDFCLLDIDFKLHPRQPETKLQIENIMNTLKTANYDEDIKTVSVEMAEHVFGIVDPSRKNDETSAYDRVYRIIQEAIDEYELKPLALVHWLTEEEMKIAIQEHVKNAVPSISSIKDPLKMTSINYPEVKPDYFQNKILQLNAGASSSEKARKTFSTLGSSKFGSNEKKNRHSK